MTITVKKIALTEQPTAIEGQFVSENYLSLIDSVEVACLVRLGTLSLTIGELRQLKHGKTLVLQQKTQEPVDILLNNNVIARGEIMSAEENFAIQITEIYL